MNYTIKQVANELELTVSTLHYYDREGLLPTIIRDTNNSRVFSKDDIEWIYMIKAMRDTGMSIGDIRKYITLVPQGRESVEARKEILEKHQHYIEEQMKAYQFISMALKEKLGHYERVIAQEEENNCYDYKDEWENFKKMIPGGTLR